MTAPPVAGFREQALGKRLRPPRIHRSILEQLERAKDNPQLQQALMAKAQLMRTR